MTEGELSPEKREIVGLTRKRRNGQTLVRSAAVEAEIRSVLQLAAAEILRRATTEPEGSEKYLSPECLVYLVRDAHRRNDEAMLWALWNVLAARASSFVESRLRTLGGPYDDDGVDAVIHNMAIAIFDLEADRGDFFQVSFWTTIQRRTIDEFRRQVRLAKEDRKHTSFDALPGEEAHPPETDDEHDSEAIVDWASESHNALEDLVGDELDVATTIRIEIALSTLPERVRQAFVLHVEGWPIESSNPNDTTISTMLGRTPRQVRNYLKEAKERLNKWREDDR
jgi:DNA-directed RNA polymerase specialized sigma24 family protein